MVCLALFRLHLLEPNCFKAHRIFHTWVRRTRVYSILCAIIAALFSLLVFIYIVSIYIFSFVNKQINAIESYSLNCADYRKCWRSHFVPNKNLKQIVCKICNCLCEVYPFHPIRNIISPSRSNTRTQANPYTTCTCNTHSSKSHGTNSTHLNLRYWPNRTEQNSVGLAKEFNSNWKKFYLLLFSGGDFSLFLCSLW